MGRLNRQASACRMTPSRDQSVTNFSMPRTRPDSRSMSSATVSIPRRNFASGPRLSRIQASMSGRASAQILISGSSRRQEARDRDLLQRLAENGLADLPYYLATIIG